MKRKSVGQRLRTIMAERNWKQKDILEAVKPFFTETVKLSKTDLSQYVNDKTEPRADKLAILAKGLGVTEQWLLGFDEEVSNISNIIYADSLQRLTVPIIGEISCTDSITAKENIDGYTNVVFNGQAPQGSLFALRCTGKSMEPTLPDASFVTIHEQSTIKDGEIAAVLVDHSNKLTLRRIKYQGDLTILVPDNKDFDPIILDKNHTGRIIGKAILLTVSL